MGMQNVRSTMKLQNYKKKIRLHLKISLKFSHMLVAMLNVTTFTQFVQICMPLGIVWPLVAHFCTFFHLLLARQESENLQVLKQLAQTHNSLMLEIMTKVEVFSLPALRYSAFLMYCIYVLFSSLCIQLLRQSTTEST